MKKESSRLLPVTTITNVPTPASCASYWINLIGLYGAVPLTLFIASFARMICIRVRGVSRTSGCYWLWGGGVANIRMNSRRIQRISSNGWQTEACRIFGSNGWLWICPCRGFGGHGTMNISHCAEESGLSAVVSSVPLFPHWRPGCSRPLGSGSVEWVLDTTVAISEFYTDWDLQGCFSRCALTVETQSFSVSTEGPAAVSRYPEGRVGLACRWSSADWSLSMSGPVNDLGISVSCSYIFH